MTDELFAHTICPKKFLKIKRIKMTHLDTAHRNGKRLEQCDTQLRTTGDISEAIILIEKLEQSHQMRISLNLVEEDYRVLLAAQFAASQSAQLKIKSRNRHRIGKIPFVQAVVQQVDFDIVLEQFFADLTDNERLSRLSGTVQMRIFCGRGVKNPSM